MKMRFGRCLNRTEELRHGRSRVRRRGAVGTDGATQTIAIRVLIACRVGGRRRGSVLVSVVRMPRIDGNHRAHRLLLRLCDFRHHGRKQEREREYGVQDRPDE